MSNSENIIVPAILCGGSGTRLWPLSRNDRPKQFLNLLGKNSMIQETALRSLRATGGMDSHVMTVTLGDLKNEVKLQMEEAGKDFSTHVLSEPSARNTAAAVAYACLYAKDSFGENAFLWILPADHHIGNEQNLKAALNEGLEAAKDGKMVTFGIEPTRPETGFGYIEKGPAYKVDTVYEVGRFVEKPDRETAAYYIETGNYLWNSGMFLFRIKTAIQQFEKYSPNILEGVCKAIESGTSELPDTSLYSEVEKQPFDKAIMEKTKDTAVVPCDLEWSDVGSWESLWEINQKDDNLNVASKNVVMHDTKNCFVQSEGKKIIACAGVKDLAIIETEDALLIADLRDSDALKELVNKLN